MERLNRTFYTCSVCGKTYETEKEALRCEKRQYVFLIRDVTVGHIFGIALDEKKGRKILREAQKWNKDLYDKRYSIRLERWEAGVYAAEGIMELIEYGG